MLHFRIDASGPIKTFDGIARRAGDTTGLLKRWGGYFRAKAHDRADRNPSRTRSRRGERRLVARNTTRRGL